VSLGGSAGGAAIDISRKPFLVVVSGPSGAGKSTVVEKVLQASDDTRFSVSLTTRPPRTGEREGDEYSFVDMERFLRARDAGKLIEWAEVHGNLYGTPSAFVEETLAAGKNVLLEIDVQGGLAVKERLPDSVLVFLLPPGLEELEKRLRGRATDDEAVIERRLANALKEYEFHSRYDYIVVNDAVDECAASILAIISAESLRRERTVLKRVTSGKDRSER
jgi:guanylate kinase